MQEILAVLEAVWSFGPAAHTDVPVQPAFWQYVVPAILWGAGKLMGRGKGGQQQQDPMAGGGQVGLDPYGQEAADIQYRYNYQALLDAIMASQTGSQTPWGRSYWAGAPGSADRQQIIELDPMDQRRLDQRRGVADQLLGGVLGPDWEAPERAANPEPWAGDADGTSGTGVLGDYRRDTNQEQRGTYTPDGGLVTTGQDALVNTGNAGTGAGDEGLDFEDIIRALAMGGGGGFGGGFRGLHSPGWGLLGSALGRRKSKDDDQQYGG